MDSGSIKSMPGSGFTIKPSNSILTNAAKKIMRLNRIRLSSHHPMIFQVEI